MSRASQNAIAAVGASATAFVVLLAGCTFPAVLGVKRSAVQRSNERVHLQCDRKKMQAECSFRHQVELARPPGEPGRPGLDYEALRSPFAIPEVEDVHVGLPRTPSTVASADTSGVGPERSEATIRGKIRLEPPQQLDSVMTAIKVRHPVLAPEWSGQSYLFRVDHPGSSEPVLTVEHPPTWSVESPAPQADEWIRQKRGTRIVSERRRLRGYSESSAFEVDVPAPPFSRGGPVLGVGTLQPPEEGAKPRYGALAGYEVAIPVWLVHRLEVDTDFRDRVVLAPSTEAATPFVLVLPSFAAGVGLPVSIRPRADVGLRLQMGVCYPFIGMVAFVDLNASTPNIVGLLIRGSL